MSDLDLIKLKEKVSDFFNEVKEMTDRENFIKLLFVMFISSLDEIGMNKKECIKLIQCLLNQIPSDDFNNV